MAEIDDTPSAIRVTAYVLAADPTRLKESVLAYYRYVTRIVVSYDLHGRGWTGAPIAAEECVARLLALDTDGKMVLSPGDYGRADMHPLQCDTRQRTEALRVASPGADWVLQLDTDEVMPRAELLIQTLETAARLNCDAVEWPMRVIFGRTRDRRLLQVCTTDGQERFEYPGPVAVRPHVSLRDARRCDGRSLRVVVAGDRRSPQLLEPAQPDEVRLEAISGEDAIVHYSWEGPPARVRAKLASWSHHRRGKSSLYFYLRWLPTPYLWRWMRDFHPFARRLWPALMPYPADNESS